MKLLNRRESAKYLHISVPTLDRHVAAGLLIPARIGKRVFFREEALDRFIKDSELAPRGQSHRHGISVEGTSIQQSHDD